MSPYRVPPVVIHLGAGDSSSDEDIEWETTGSPHTTTTDKAGQSKGGMVPEGLDMFLREIKQQTATAKVSLQILSHKNISSDERVLSALPIRRYMDPNILNRLIS